MGGRLTYSVSCGPARRGPSGSASADRPNGPGEARDQLEGCWPTRRARWPTRSPRDPDRPADGRRPARKPAARGQRALVQADARRLRAGGERPRLREINAGKNYPPPVATLDYMRWLGAGWPDYTWLFGTDGEYTAFASVAAGQFGPIKDHLRALRDVSVGINGAQRQDRARGDPGRRGVLRRQRRPGQHRRVVEVPLRRRAGLALDRRRGASWGTSTRPARPR